MPSHRCGRHYCRRCSQWLYWNNDVIRTANGAAGVHRPLAVNALGSLETRVTLTTPQDIGTLTAEIVFFEPRLRNQIVYLAGDTVTYGQVADILERVLGRPFKRNVWTVAHLIQELEKDPTHHIKKYRAVFAQGRGVTWPKAGKLNEQQSIQVNESVLSGIKRAVSKAFSSCQFDHSLPEKNACLSVTLFTERC